MHVLTSTFALKKYPQIQPHSKENHFSQKVRRLSSRHCKLGYAGQAAGAAYSWRPRGKIQPWNVLSLWNCGVAFVINWLLQCWIEEGANICSKFKGPDHQWWTLHFALYNIQASASQNSFFGPINSMLAVGIEIIGTYQYVQNSTWGGQWNGSRRQHMLDHQNTFPLFHSWDISDMPGPAASATNVGAGSPRRWQFFCLRFSYQFLQG